MNLENANFFNYRNGEFLQFMKNAYDIFDGYDLVTLLLTARVNAWHTSTLALDDVFQPILANELTPELSALDIRRDNDLIGIKTYLESQLYRSDPVKTAAAQKLKANYLSHGDRIDKLSYQQETAVVNAMLHDWSEGVLLAAVSNLLLTDWVADLASANTDFDTRYVQRAQNMPQPAEIDAKRLTMKTTYDDLVQDVVAYSRIAAVATPYLNIISALNGLIDNYNTAVNHRLATNGPDAGSEIPPVVNT